MTYYNGNDFLLRIGTSSTAGTLVAAMRMTGFSIGQTIVDVTNKDSNMFREILSAAGTKSMSITAEGVMSDSTTIDAMMTSAHNGSNSAFGISWGDLDRWDASFKVTNLSAQGGNDAEQTYSLALESSGSITLTTA